MNTTHRSAYPGRGLRHGDHRARSHTRRSALASLLAAGQRFAARVRQARRRRQAIHELSALSDARLADIGVPRDRIPEVVDGLLRAETAPPKPARDPAPARPAPARLRAAADCPECA